MNVALKDAFPLVNPVAGPVFVESSGVQIVVERAEYRSEGSVFWTEGASALATKLQ